MQTQLVLLLTLLCAAVSAQPTGHDDHVASEHAWEYAGTFDLHPTTKMGPLSLIFSVDSKNVYADSSNNLLLLKTTATTKDGIEAMEDAATGLFANPTTFTALQPNSAITPGTVFSCKMSLTAPVTVFSVQEIVDDGAYVLFSQHLPSEFEGFAGHYFKSKNGLDIEALAQEVATHKIGGKPVPLSPSPAAVSVFRVVLLLCTLGSVGFQ